MINITSIPPAIWSPAPGPAIAAVARAAPVQPVSRDTQSGPGASGRDASGSAQGVRWAGTSQARAGESSEGTGAAEAAPLLPRESTDESRIPDKTEAKAELDEERQAQLAQEKAYRQQLKDVIANVWKASAAVVDVALGQQDMAANNALKVVGPGNEGQAAPPEPRPVPPANRDDSPFVPPRRLAQEVVAYDALGQGSLAPQESGARISRKA
jgi:hypothetical protein